MIRSSRALEIYAVMTALFSTLYCDKKLRIAVLTLLTFAALC